jgi:hypothetical protein
MPTGDPRVLLRRIPKTQLTFVNVFLVPVRTRAGETRYMSATWGGAVYLFDRAGRGPVFPLPEGTFGSYSLAADAEPGFAWVVFTGGKIARVDVDAGRIDFMQSVPLENLNWSAVVTREGLLVCSAHPGDVMVYDTRRREVKHLLRPFAPPNRAGKYLQAAPDGGVIVANMLPDAEFVRLDPRTGQITRADATPHLGATRFLPPSVTLLPEGRYAVPRADGVALLSYPEFRQVGTTPYPGDGEWRTFRNEEDGRLFAFRNEEEPLYVLGPDGAWQVWLERFPRQLGKARLETMFAALPGNRLLALSAFGECVEYDPSGAPRLVAELDNYGYQRICDLAPAEGARVFTTTFINSSFQELDLRTGEGRNHRPCQKRSGQASTAVWAQGRLWLGCYGGAEITEYDPRKGGDWPENPRPFADIGHEQMRPISLAAEGRHLWCDTNAHYGKHGGALTRIDTATGDCRVRRHPVPDHNVTGIVVDTAARRIYGGTTVWPDQQSAPAAQGPAAVYAFDIARESVLWRAQPLEGAAWMSVHALWRGTVIAAANGKLILLRAEDGSLLRVFDANFPEGEPAARLFVGGDGALHLASREGLFRYDLDRGPGERLIDGPVGTPRVRGADFFFVREFEVGFVEGLWRPGPG